MRENLTRLARRLFADRGPAESFATDFDSVAQMADAARAFRSHGCGVSLGNAALRLVVTVPRPSSDRLRQVKTHG